MVPFLLANIPHDGGCEGLANTERSIAGLPVESGKTPAAVEPTRGNGLHHPQGVRRRHRRRQRAEQVHVVRSGVCGSEHATQFAHNSAQVAQEIALECRGNQWLAVFGAENHVGQQVGVRMGHILSPLRGLAEILHDSFTHRLRSGLPPFARYAGFEVHRALILTLMGFTLGAKLQRGRSGVQRRVDFNQGVDARILCKERMFLRELSTICLKPLRIAFDHLGLRKPHEQSIRYACEFGLTELSNYTLYNFHDTPADLYERMRLNVTLNEELGIRIWSFPMRYQPTDLPDRSHIGEKWTRYQLRSMQIILQATHGVVSGQPEFFGRAFGEDAKKFDDILLMPHHF